MYQNFFKSFSYNIYTVYTLIIYCPVKLHPFLTACFESIGDLMSWLGYTDQEMEGVWTNSYTNGKY